MTFAEGLYEYFAGCPLFAGQSGLYFNHYGFAGSATIETPAGGQVVRRYLSGSVVKQKPIVLGSVESYGPDNRVQLAASNFYEALAQWVKQQNAAGNLPKIPAGAHPVSLVCTTHGYLQETGENTARYQMELTLTYLEQAPECVSPLEK